MTQRYYSIWKVEGHQYPYFIKIFDYENTPFGWGFPSSTPEQLTIASEGIKLQYNGREDNVFEPIKTSSFQLDLIIENDNQARLIEAARLTKEFNLGLEYGYVVDVLGQDVFICTWRGVLAPQSVQVDYGIDPYGASLTFVDGLALLSEYSYRDVNGAAYEDHVPLRVHMQRCLQYLPTLPLFPSNAACLDYCTNIYHDNHDINATNTGPDVDVLYRVGCNSKTFYQESPRDNYFNNLFLVKRKTMSCYDVLHDILVTMQLTLTMREGRYFVFSHFPYLVDGTFYQKYRYTITKDQIVNLSHVSGTKQSVFDNNWVAVSTDYDILVGSKEGILPPAAGVSYVHENGGSSSVFPRASVHIIDVNYSSAANLPLPHGNLGDFQPEQQGALLGGFPKQDDEIEIPSGTGFRMRGRIRMRVRNPRNDSLSDANDPVSRQDEMIGAKIILSMKIQVGNYYLKQTATQSTAANFTDETDWGEIIIQAGAPGSSAASPSYYYPILHGDAEWTTNAADRFEFMVLHPDFTQPAVETLEYDDEFGVVTEYPLGLWLKRQTDTVNKARYSSDSYQEWLGENGINQFIDWLDAAIGTFAVNNNYTNPVVESTIDLQLPALPDAAGDQTGIVIDCSIKGYTAEGYILYDTDVASWPTPSTNYSWMGNVLIGPPSIMDFEFFLGDASRAYDPMYSAEDDNPEGTEDLLLGSTVLGSRYDGRLGPLGYLHTAVFDQNGEFTGTGTYERGWNSVSLPQSNTDLGILQVCANVGMNYYGSAKRQFQLLLKSRAGLTVPVSFLTPGSLFYFVEENMTLLIQKVSNDLHRGVIDLLAVELNHDPRTITEYDTTPNRGLAGGGMAPAPGGVNYSHRVFVEGRRKGRSMLSEQASKLSFINLNQAGTGVDSITGFVSGSLSAADQAKLAAITLDGAGTAIADFTVNGTPLTSDEVDDSTSTNKFATQAELNAIAGNTASISDIYSVFKETTTGGGAGIYINTASTAESYVGVTATSAKLQSGENTAIDLTETSPGTINLNVQAGAVGSEAQVTGLRVQGSSTVNTKATVSILGGEFRVNSPTQYSSGASVTFQDTVTFSSSTSGISHADLTNKPPFYHGVLLDGAGGGELIGSGSITFAVNDLLSNTGSGLEGVWMCNTAVTINQAASESQALSNFNAQIAKFTKIASPGDLSLADLDPSSPADTFSDTLTSFSLTTTSGLTLSGAGGIILIGNTTGIGNITATGNVTGGNLTTAGTLTASGLTYPTSDGTSGQVLTTNGSGALSFSTVSGGGGGAAKTHVTWGFFDTNIRDVFIPILNETETTTRQRYNVYVAPSDGEVTKISIFVTLNLSGGTGASFAVQKMTGATSFVTLATASITSINAYQPQVLTFTGATFNAGDRLYFWVVNGFGTAWGNIMGTIEIEL